MKYGSCECSMISSSQPMLKSSLMLLFFAGNSRRALSLYTRPHNQRSAPCATRLAGGWLRSTRLHTPSCATSTQDTLVDRLRNEFAERETDGIIAIANDLNDRDWVSIVDDVIAASDGRRGTVASMMNSLIASCSLTPDASLGAIRAQELFGAFPIDDASSDNDPDVKNKKAIDADLVTCSLAYNAMQRSDSLRHEADTILDQASRQSKKLAGSQRRKALAAAKRKHTPESFTEMTPELQSMLGDQFSILTETDDYVVINKPNGVACFHARKTTAGKTGGKKRKPSKEGGASRRKGSKDTVDISLEDAFMALNLRMSTLNHEAMGIVHRLDRGTSGCMIVAKTNDMHARLVTSFFLRRAKKVYTAALVLPDDRNDDDLTKDAIHVDDPVQNHPASSTFRFVRRTGERIGIFKVDLNTGRKHQVRIHAAEALGAPVMLDITYGPKPCDVGDSIRKINGDGDRAIDPRWFCLHASELSIPEHRVDVEAALPAWWDTLDLTRAE